MLVLSRKSQQSIIICSDIEVVVIAVEGGRVKLGFNAPRHVPIRRGEIQLRSRSTSCDDFATTAAMAEAESVLADLKQAGEE